MATKYIHSRHRRFSLAERHLRELRNEFPRKIVSISYRHNAEGKPSGRGTFYRFAIKDKKKKKKNVAWLLSFSYTPEAKGNKRTVSADLIVPAPANATKSEVIRRAEDLAFADFTKTWLLWLLANADDQDITVSRAEKGVKVPRRILVRSADREGKPIYDEKDEGSDSDE